MFWKSSGALITLSILFFGSCYGCNNDTEFTCQRINQCVPMEWRCDGASDCRDGTDEFDCNYIHKCPVNMYNCQDGDCIDAVWKCDGSIDCHNGRDELACGSALRASRVKTESSDSSTTQTKKIAGIIGTDATCHDNMYQCDGGACIHPGFRCDGQQDCPLGDDEKDCSSTKSLCPETQRPCKSNDECVPTQWWCDGEPDCQDQSDEEGCGGAEPFTESPSTTTSSSTDVLPLNQTTAHSEGTCNENQYRCKRSHLCIDMLKTCDGIEDCPEGDDEAGACRECLALDCIYDCRATVKEATCHCPTGMVTDPQDYRGCIKDNPCLHQSHCAHFCKPTDNQNYICSCDVGFQLDVDQHLCIPQTDPFGGELLFSVGNEIRVSSLHADETHASRYHTYSAIDTGENLYHLAMDVRGKSLWAGIAGHDRQWRIAKTINGELKSLRVGFPELGNIQFDWINRNVYFVTGGRSETPYIYVCDENMLYCSKLVRGLRSSVDEHGRKHIQAFRGLALHPRRGLMCWIEIFMGVDKVKCANMDGSDVHTVIDRKLVDPTTLVWDTLKNDLYVADAGNELIERINYDSREQRVIGRIINPFAMAFFNGMLYYSEMEMNVIKSLDVSTDHHLMPHIERSFSHRPFGLTINHTLAQNTLGIEACPATLECQYACVSYMMETTAVHSCLCPEGYEAGVDRECVFPENRSDYKADSYVDLEYMKSLCETGKACGANGQCVYNRDDTTNEVEDIRCECNSGYTGLFCELTDGKAMADALEGQETSFITIVLLVLAFLVVLAITFFCIHEKHQPFREFTKSTKEAVMDSSPHVLQAIRNSVHHVHEKIVSKTAKTQDTMAPITSSFSSPVFQDAKENTTLDAEVGSPLVKKSPLSSRGSPPLVSSNPVPPVPSTGVRSVFGNFENPSFRVPSPPSEMYGRETWEASLTSRSEPEFHLGDDETTRNVY
ncbi:unnamed protein product, partial [Mesorhabditis belari]|uniref:EGF-like domain-containing protein n=1 Tax=Mesorhabditis belari TaxID=2138241 RepID=A0AAF3J795_9BILA